MGTYALQTRLRHQSQDVEGRTEHGGTKFTPSVKEAVDAVARDCGLSRSSFIHDAVLLALTLSGMGGKNQVHDGAPLGTRIYCVEHYKCWWVPEMEA